MSLLLVSRLTTSGYKEAALIAALEGEVVELKVSPLSLPDTQGSYVAYTGLFCRIHRPLLPHTRASFAAYTGLF